MLKYLRIAVTALSLTGCVLLVALWVRSYSRFDLTANRVFFSVMGRVYINGAIAFEPEDLLTEPDVQTYKLVSGRVLWRFVG